MTEVEQITGALLAVLLAGGKDAVKEISKGSVLWAKDSIVKLWNDIFKRNEKVKELAEKTVAESDNQTLREELKKELLETLRVMSDEQSYREVRADHGSVAIGNASGNVTVNIHND